MSWLDRVETDFTITTGDGKLYTLYWVNATKLVEYNIAEFDFPKLGGTLVSRGTPRGARYNLELFFNGEDHIDRANDFEKSAEDQRAWTIAHPLYDSIIVQPLSLIRDNTQMNVTKLMIPVVQTIVQENPITNIDPLENLGVIKDACDETFANSLTKTPNAKDITTTTGNINKNYEAAKGKVVVPSQAEGYCNAYKKANAAILKVSSDPIQGMRTMQAYINYPFLFTTSVTNRINTFTDQFNNIRLSLATLLNPASKQLYQIQGGGLISGQCMAAATPLIGDYTNRQSVLSVISVLIANYNQYLNDLDTLQSDNGGSVNSFIPDAGSQIALNQLVNTAISSLFTIALSSRQERTLFLSEDTNLVELTHRLYSLDPDDNNMNELMINNNWSINQLLGIKKGTKVTYYI